MLLQGQGDHNYEKVIQNSSKNKLTYNNNFKIKHACNNAKGERKEKGNNSSSHKYDN